MSESDPEKYPDILRRLIEQENSVQNNRFTWFSAFQGFLFAAIAFAWDKGTPGLVVIIGVLGIVSSLSASAALHLSDLAFENLKNWWDANLKHYAGPPSGGYDAGRYFLVFVLPSRLLPWIFMAAWMAILAHRLSACTTHS